MGIHEGHRKRKKEQFLRHGLDAFADHEVLELLLFYAVARQDTNDLAHRLLNRFGTLLGVFSATADELQKVEGVGESTAAMLTLLLPLYRRMQTSNEKEIILSSQEDAGAYFKELFFGCRTECMYEACLDAKWKLIRCFRMDGGVDSVYFNIRTMVENAIHSNASFVILAHNHPSGLALPSNEDNIATQMLQNALKPVGILLTDHLIFADNDFVSLQDNGLLC